jgi:ABC-type antimicrobial peptide transport system permease subunit
MQPLLKRNLLLSLSYAVGAALAAYALAWGLFTTHSELGVPTSTALPIAAWVLPIVFVGSIIVLAARSASARRH